MIHTSGFHFVSYFFSQSGLCCNENRFQKMKLYITSIIRSHDTAGPEIPRRQGTYLSIVLKGREIVVY